MKKLFILFIAVAGFSVSSLGQAVTSTSPAGARILTPLTITNTTPLNFGSAAPSIVATTTVVLSNTGDARTGSTATLYGLAPAAKTGIFSITGNASTIINITLPTNGTVSLTGPGVAMPVTAFSSDIGITPTLSAGGAATLGVGATLTLGINQLSGTYSGNYDVTVNYD